MTYRSVVVHAGTDARASARFDLAHRLAQAFDASLTGVFVIPPPAIAAPVGDPAALVGYDLMAAQRQASEERAATAEAAFRAVCSDPSRCAWRIEDGESGSVLAHVARYADLTVVAQSESEGLAAMATQLPERVVMGAGGPVLVVPYAGRFERFGERIVVAWDGSREAARAVRDALPLLERAIVVTVLEIDPPDRAGAGGRALAERLARHRVEVVAEHTVSGGLAIGEVLLSALADRAADALVMGAYGHSRLRELTLGGVTRTVLAHMTVPVLMSC